MLLGGPLNEDVSQDRAEQAVEHDRLGQREAEPLNALELAAKLGLARDRLDHRAEDVADADARAERAEADAEGEPDRLPGFCYVARGGGEKSAHGRPPSVEARSPSRCRWLTKPRRGIICFYRREVITVVLCRIAHKKKSSNQVIRA